MSYFDEEFGGGFHEEPEYEDTDEGVLSEVEVRLAKANCYRVLLESDLFSGGDESAEEVESEVRDFVRERLAILMGMKAERPENETSPFPFTDEEVQVLKGVASRVLTKPATPTVRAAEVHPEGNRPASPTLKPAELKTKQKPQTKKADTKAASPRKKGRPKGSKNKRPSDTVVKTDPSGKERIAHVKQQVRPLNSQGILPMPSIDRQNALMMEQAGSGIVDLGSIETPIGFLGGLLAQSINS